jgi:hypothetical protein
MTMRRAYETAATLMFSLVLIYLPFYRGLLVAGAGRSLLLVLLALLLLFLVTHQVEVGRAMRVLARAIFGPAAEAGRDTGFAALSLVELRIPPTPNLAVLFERPPPFRS